MTHIRTWKSDEKDCPQFELRLFDTYSVDSLGKCRLAYRFYHEGKLIFEGSDFCCSPCYAIDSDACVGALLGFLSLRKGDTDADYFDDYTDEQIKFSDSFGEELSMYVYELENEED